MCFFLHSIKQTLVSDLAVQLKLRWVPYFSKHNLSKSLGCCLVGLVLSERSALYSSVQCIQLFTTDFLPSCTLQGVCEVGNT